MTPATVEEVKERLALWQAEHRAEVAAAHERRKSRTNRPPTTEITKQRQRASNIAHQRSLLTPDSPYIRRLRLERGLSVNEASILCGISPRTYRRVENTPHKCGALVLWRVAKAFRLPGIEVLQ